MSLLALQRDVRAWLVHEDRSAARRIGESAAAGLDVYMNNYRAQLIACLDEAFPHTRAWLGGDLFLQSLVTHIDRVPPSSWTLDAYARDFPATLSSAEVVIRFERRSRWNVIANRCASSRMRWSR